MDESVVAAPSITASQAHEPGGPPTAESLFALLYDELHRIAKREARRGAFVNLGATTLLHETYLQLCGRDGIVFPDEARFLAYAARAMRGLVIDSVRHRGTQKRGGLFEITALDTRIAETIGGAEELHRIGDALAELEHIDPVLAHVVDLKFFCGFSFREIAAMQNVSERTVQRQWEKARIYLRAAMTSSDATVRVSAASCAA